MGLSFYFFCFAPSPSLFFLFLPFFLLLPTININNPPTLDTVHTFFSLSFASMDDSQRHRLVQSAFHALDHNKDGSINARDLLSVYADTFPTPEPGHAQLDEVTYSLIDEPTFQGWQHFYKKTDLNQDRNTLSSHTTSFIHATLFSFIHERH
ncbi:hypothetical protein K457DRAFT_680979 [Linnemannia elongata AG-77]|uniref:EF-hand domain-containing protein n=1 Tax=Linnemannia elongata AG-77 TaxID=1314771 RepID=A0A197JP35_9FUNG|nr:hypothetical protein K457DRAFT_680979 [Linnemannia elongata AG-77]